MIEEPEPAQRQPQHGDCNARLPGSTKGCVSTVLRRHVEDDSSPWQGRTRLRALFMDLSVRLRKRDRERVRARERGSDVKWGREGAASVPINSPSTLYMYIMLNGTK
eukprot:1018751-Rhodomonas_salina.2